LLALELLKPEDRVKARAIMGPVPEDIREAVINQWKHRCTTGNVAKPLAYLTTLAGKALRGDFNAEWSPAAPATAPTSTPPAATAVIRPTQPSGLKPAPTAATMQTANVALSSLLALLDPRRQIGNTGE
jgi:hypothetical protein